MGAVKTDLGFYLISDEEYYKLDKPEEDVVYVLVNTTDTEYLVLKNGQFMGKIDANLANMKMTAGAIKKAAAENKYDILTRGQITSLGIDLANAKKYGQIIDISGKVATMVEENQKKKKRKKTTVTFIE